MSQPPLETSIDLHAALAAVPRACVAYSGGLDSSVLLHLAAAQRPAATALRALHINHQLQPDADAWQAHCAARCAELDLPFSARRVDAAAARGESPEAAARRARRSAFAAELARGELLLLAQHGDDQIESVLLMLLRGSGPAGLAGMAERASCGDGQLWRPLLGATRAQIADYAARHGLRWVEDPSNADTAFARNHLRQRVLPALRAGPGFAGRGFTGRGSDGRDDGRDDGRQRGAAVAGAFARSARLCAEADALLGELAELDLQRAADGDCLSLTALRRLSAPRCRNLLRYWIAARGLPAPTEKQLQRVLNEVLFAREDAQCRVHWGAIGGGTAGRGDAAAQIRRYRDRLYLLAAGELVEPPAGRLLWADPGQPLQIPGCDLRIQPALLDGLRLPPGARLEIGFRRGGERLRVACGADRRPITRPLKKLLQEAGLPPWQRGQVPLLFVDGELAAALGVACGANFAGFYKKLNNQ